MGQCHQEPTILHHKYLHTLSYCMDYLYLVGFNGTYMYGCYMLCCREPPALFALAFSDYQTWAPALLHCEQVTSGIALFLYSAHRVVYVEYMICLLNIRLSEFRLWCNGMFICEAVKVEGKT